MDRVRDSLVALWKTDQATDAANFVGNGVFIGDQWILTARHVAEQANFFRAHVNELSALAVETREIYNGECDLALLKVPRCPGTRRLQIASVHMFAPGDALVYTGYLPDNAMNNILQQMHDQRVSISNTIDPRYGTWSVTPSIPAGHSGSGVRDGEVLIAIAVLRNKKDRIGYLVDLSIGEIRKWIESHVREAYRLPELTLREQFRACFEHRAFELAGLRGSHKYLPDEIESSLQKGTQRERGDACMTAVLNLTEDLTTRHADVADFGVHRELLKLCLCDAMEIAVRMLINVEPECPVIENRGGYVEIAAMHSPTAAILLTKEKASRLWHLARLEGGAFEADTDGVVKLPSRELGSGPYLIEELLPVVEATLPPELLPPASTKRFEARRNRVGATMATQQRRIGRQFSRIPHDCLAMYTSEALAFLSRMHLPPILLPQPPGEDTTPEPPTPTSSGVFLVDEVEVVECIRQLLWRLDKWPKP